MTNRNATWLGIDGGGTKTDLALLDADGDVIARLQGPTSNQAVVGLEQASQVLTTLIRDACSQANVEPPITSGWIGMAGTDRPEDQQVFSSTLSHLFGEVRITNDAELVLSGTPDGIGIALIGGTGSIAFARNEMGVSGRSGGWGHIIGDEGSACVVAVEGLRAVAAEADGRGPSTALTAVLMDYWNAETPHHLIPRIYDPGVKKGDIAASAPVVVAAANNGDTVALRILERAGDALAELVTSLAKRIPFASPSPVACAGGLLLRSKTVRARVSAALDPSLVQPELQVVEDIALSTAQAVRRFSMKGAS